MIKLTGIIVMFLAMGIVLYCSKQHGTGEELKDYRSAKLLKPPQWAQNGVLYQVFVRVFTEKGTFRALESKLDYIEDLGVNTIWLMPIYPIGVKGRKGSMGSPYSVRDFRKINPDYGGGNDFRSLVNAIHNREMKVIIGMVSNHAANDNVLINDHPSWFMQNASGEFTREVADWSDITDFNYHNPDMREYMLETLVYWVKKFDIDGYRCDVAGMVPLDFWKKSLVKLREIKSDIYLLAEWEDPEILMAGFNSDYGWTEYHTFKEIRQGKKRTPAIINVIQEKDSRYPQNALPMRFLENHDEKRSLYVFGAEAIEAYATLLFTLPGIPLIYAGQEFGETEKPSLFEKSALNWMESDTSLIKVYKSLIELRKKYSCFTEGKFIPLQTATMSGSAAAFLRDSDNNVALVVCNLGKKTAEKILITPPDTVKNRLKSVTLMNVKNQKEKITLEKIYFDKILPFQTLIFVGEKSI